MKKLFTVIAVALSITAYGQKVTDVKKSDTLVIDFYKVKYIKIGDRVFKIESPTLTEVKEPERYNWGNIISVGPHVQTLEWRGNEIEPFLKEFNKKP